MQPDLDSAPGSAAYSSLTLRFYDVVVLGLTSSLVWRCPAARMQALYDQWASARHLDVGVGTGHFLDRCRFGGGRPALTLLDLSPNSLRTVGRRLRRYAPALCRADALRPAPLRPGQFGSVGMTYLLHCLPGTLRQKARVFDHLAPLLGAGGVLFGSTLLASGAGVRHTAASRRLMEFYNRRGFFSNRHDTREELEAALRARFGEVSLAVYGCVGCFVARYCT